MTTSYWWRSISTAELLGLRRRLLERVTAEFGGTLKAELEDVVQQAFAILFRHRESVKADNDGLYRYLKTVSRHVALDRVKAARRRQAYLAGLSQDSKGRAAASDAESTLSEELAEENEKIWQIFCALDDLDRLVMWSHVVEGRSIRAVARDLGLNWHRVAAIIEETLRSVRIQLT